MWFLRTYMFLYLRCNILSHSRELTRAALIKLLLWLCSGKKCSFSRWVLIKLASHVPLMDHNIFCFWNAHLFFVKMQTLGLQVKKGGSAYSILIRGTYCRGPCWESYILESFGHQKVKAIINPPITDPCKN